MRGIVLYFFLAGMLSLSACSDEKSSKLRVLSSIKPIQAIVIAIAGDHATSHQLIPDSASPHNYTFKPSDMRKVTSSDIIFRIDEHFEVMLNSVLKSVSDQSKIISLAENPAIHLLPLAGGHSHANHSNEHESVDMHIFTSPENSIAMAQIIANSLSKLDPKNTQNYKNNLQQFSKKVLRVSRKIKSELAPFKDKPYIVFHNSWQYFGEYFGLQKPKILHLQEGISAGAKTIVNARNEIISKNIHCVFSNPSISSKRISTLTEGLTIKSVEIDVLARQFPISQDTYIDWLEHVGQQVKNCLKE